MSEQNVCPHCGQSRIFYVGGGVYGCGPGRTAVCAACNARGQQRLTDDLALEAFTHPAHLLKDEALVDVDDLTEVLNILEDANNPAIDRLWSQLREGMVK